jgi:hypothetical protein
MVIKVLRRRRKILGFTILLQAGVSFNHDPKEFASFEIHPSTTLKYAIFFVSRYPKRGLPCTPTSAILTQSVFTLT